MQVPEEHFFYMFYKKYLQYEYLYSIYFGSSAWKPLGLN